VCHVLVAHAVCAMLQPGYVNRARMRRQLYNQPNNPIQTMPKRPVYALGFFYLS
jgi:hypothetical protein